MQFIAPMLGRVRRDAAAVAHRRAIPAALLAFALLLCTTLWMWQSTRAENARAAEERFEFKTGEARTAMAQRLLAYEQVLRGAVALFAASDAVTRDEWHTYVRTLEIERNFLGIQGIGFSAWLPATQLATHVAQVRATGFPDYAVRPEGARAEYAPILYMEPSDWRNQRALGYDMLAEPALRHSLERARDTGLPSASGKVKLVQETTDDVQSGFALCLPVFRNGAPQSTLAERRAALTGHVCSTFRMHDLLQGVLGAETLSDIQLRIFDGSQPSPASKMYDTLEGADGGEPAAAFELDKGFEFGGHQWTLRFDSLPSFEAGTDAQKANYILGGGLSISMLFAAVAWSLSLNRHRARALAAANGGLQAEIAERTKLEGQLERARDLAEAANHAKSEFLANVSHELRTPLTLILAPVEQLLAAGEAPPAWPTQLARVQRNALLLMNRVNEILDFSKAQAGKFQPSPEIVDLDQAIGAMAGDAAAVAERKGCTLTWHVDPALRSVCLDPGLFDKIAMNLVSNAIKFTPAGGTIALRAAPLDDGAFEFAVQDSGIGVAPDKLPLLFERFSQVDHSATRHHGGTGIGLALVKELVALMGGSVGVDSEPGVGSRFFVRLPIGRPPDDAPAPGDAHAPRPRTAIDAALRRLQLDDGKSPQPGPAKTVQASDRHGARPCVMVVDDTPDLLAYVTELLQDECEVVSAADGELAWALLQRVPVQAIVSDVMMPNLDGLGLTARLKASASWSHVPIILLTARGGGDASVTGLDSGADDYIAKPFSPGELKARVRAALRMGQMQAQLRDRSHQAGMAEIATNVLHNVGNVLNSVNVSAGLVASRMQASQVTGLTRAVELMDAHAADLGDFLTRDARGKLLPSYLGQLAQALVAERHDVVEELRQLEKGVDHIKEIVATQQSYARAAGVVEAVRVGDLVDDALRMNAVALARHEVGVVRQLADLPLLRLDKHRLLLILVNLISNAKYAMDGVHDRPHQLTVQAQAPSPGTLRIRLVDNGEGIAPENLARIFSHGFTTRRNGHGFGLHSCVLAAREMGGTLAAHSDGPGRGATFTLELPIHAAEGIS